MSCPPCVTHVLSPCPPAVVRRALAPNPSRNARPKWSNRSPRKSGRRGRRRLRPRRARSPFATAWFQLRKTHVTERCPDPPGVHVGNALHCYPSESSKTARILDCGGRAQRRHRFSTADKASKAAWRFASCRSPKRFGCGVSRAMPLPCSPSTDFYFLLSQFLFLPSRLCVEFRRHLSNLKAIRPVLKTGLFC
jgi:hypothetical protein